MDRDILIGEINSEFPESFRLSIVGPQNAKDLGLT
jgi:hypothetical protein